MPPFPPSLASVYAALDKSPGLVDSLVVDDLTLFIRLVSLFKKRIIYSQPPSEADRTIPLTLPHELKEFLGSALRLSSSQVEICWDALKETIWLHDAERYSPCGLAHTVHTHSAGALGTLVHN